MNKLLLNILSLYFKWHNVLKWFAKKLCMVVERGWDIKDELCIWLYVWHHGSIRIL